METSSDRSKRRRSSSRTSNRSGSAGPARRTSKRRRSSSRNSNRSGSAGPARRGSRSRSRSLSQSDVFFKFKHIDPERIGSKSPAARTFVHGRLGEAKKKKGKGLWCDGTDPLLFTRFEEGDEVYKAVPFNLSKESMKRQTRCYSKETLDSEGPGMKRRDNGPSGEPLTQEDRNRFFPADDEDSSDFDPDDYNEEEDFDSDSDSDTEYFNVPLSNSLNQCINRILAQQPFDGITDLELSKNNITLAVIYRLTLDARWRFRLYPSPNVIRTLDASCESSERGETPFELEHMYGTRFRLRFL